MQNQNHGIKCPESKIYTVCAGDSIISIAQSFDLSARTIMEQNPYVDPTALIAGQALCIPQNNTEPTQTARARFNDTIQDILFRHNLTQATFAQLNPTITTPRLMPGQAYQVPGEA